MRKQIRGVLYDTDTAREIARWESDIEGVDEVLYRTKSGKYFILAVRLHVDSRTHVIVPVERSRAIWLACSALGIEESRPLFDVEDREGTRPLSVRVSERTYSIIREEAAARGISMGTVIEEMVGDGDSLGGAVPSFDDVAEAHVQYHGDHMIGSSIYGWEEL